MIHSAAEQALGFSYQFDRAVFRLLTSDISVVEVGIEYLDDVSQTSLDGTVIREQDKTSASRKYPLSDRSEALWKTLKIWCNAVRDDSNILDKTIFHLVTNGRVSIGSLVHKIHEVRNLESSKLLAQEIRLMATDLREDLQKHGKDILLLEESLLSKLLLKIEVFDEVSQMYGGDIEEIHALRYYPSPINTSIFDQARGWVIRRMIEAVENRKQPRINRIHFDQEMQSILRRVQLAPYSMMIVPVDPNLDVEEYKDSGFVQQLNWIELNESRIKNEIINYVQARDTRQSWSEGVVSEGELLAYQGDLYDKWLALSEDPELSFYPTKELKGQKLLSNTMLQTTYINSQQVPTAFTAGCYHALADYSIGYLPKLGWHPEFKQKVLKVLRGEME